MFLNAHELKARIPENTREKSHVTAEARRNRCVRRCRGRSCIQMPISERIRSPKSFGQASLANTNNISMRWLFLYRRRLNEDVFDMGGFARAGTDRPQPGSGDSRDDVSLKWGLSHNSSNCDDEDAPSFLKVFATQERTPKSLPWLPAIWSRVLTCDRGGYGDTPCMNLT